MLQTQLAHTQAAEAGKILAFRALARRSVRPAPAAGAECGRLLLFTGVRYERFPDERSFNAAAGGGRTEETGRSR